MMIQYGKIKEQYPDCLLFFRLGDFYELFLDDAKIGADILDITLTKRPRGKDGHIPMAGVPYHVADTYIARLVKAGQKVAVCEQVSEPNGKGIVEREVIRVVTPGTLLDEKNLDKRKNNFIMSMSYDDKSLGISVADLSTGDFLACEISHENDFLEELETELARFSPNEFILRPSHYEDHTLLKTLSQYKDLNLYSYNDWDYHADGAEKQLTNHFRVESLKSFGLNDKKHAQKACSVLIEYLRETQKTDISHINTIKSYSREKSVVLDKSTIKNLEIFTTIHEGKKSDTLIHLLDQTLTSMGARKLRSWIKNPLVTKLEIDNRLVAIQELIKSSKSVDTISENLEEIYDVERVLARLSVGLGSPVDLIHIKESTSSILKVKANLKNLKSPLLKKYGREISTSLKEVVKVVDEKIVEDPPFDTKHGGIIRDGKNKKLDSLRDKISSSKVWLEELEAKEREKTGISSLKVRFNKVFGYYIEVNKTHTDKVPKRYIRKQTLVNAERFITDELKKHEEMVFSAEEKIFEIEYEIFKDVVSKILSKTTELQRAASSIASVDCLISSSKTAIKHHYVKPKITNNGKIRIKSGRHPVVEDALGGEFVPNDTNLNQKDHQMIILTGPNMAGKSVYMRQVALITLMAHCGMFVPAEKAEISLVDRIFVRSGAADVITGGLSTFMLEMVETANILNNATDKSLIVMDEVGRGTSTYDGISIAWAIVEYLVKTKGKGAKTLFATHYHELQDLEEVYPKSCKNYSMAIEDKSGTPIFLYQVIRGGASMSHGISVARLAGIPERLIDTAKEKLIKLEESHAVKSDINHTRKKNVRNDSDSIIKELASIDVDNTTPLEALKKLNKLKKLT